MTLAAIADAKVVRACAAIAAQSRAVVPDFLPPPVIRALAAVAHRRDAAGEFRAAGIGRGPTHAERNDIRGDRTLWLDEQAPALAERPLWEALERLRIALNETTFLGLFAFEGHYALYPPGAGYRRHRDCFRDDDTRVLSCALYLNQAWTAADGGMLRLYLAGDELCDILPVGGTLVCFLADRFEHEVLPARRDRLAIAGWFRRRNRQCEC
jgi:SM-20-related protein